MVSWEVVSIFAAVESADVNSEEKVQMGVSSLVLNTVAYSTTVLAETVFAAVESADINLEEKVWMGVSS